MAPGADQLAGHLTERQVIDAMDPVSARWMSARREHGVPVVSGGRVVEIRTEFEDDGEDGVDVAQVLRGWLHRLHDERNRLLHDSWFVGWGNETTTDWSTAELQRIDPRRHDPHVQRDLTADDLRALSSETRDASKVAMNFMLQRRLGFASYSALFEIRAKRIYLREGRSQTASSP